MASCLGIEGNESADEQVGDGSAKGFTAGGSLRGASSAHMTRMAIEARFAGGER